MHYSTMTKIIVCLIMGSGLTHFIEISAFCQLKIVENDCLASK